MVVMVLIEAETKCFVL